MKVFTKSTVALILAAQLTAVSYANQNDDVKVVEKLIEIYPQVDLTKEAVYQTQIISQKYDKNLASVLLGKIRYKTSQNTLARKAFKAVDANSEFFKYSVLSYFTSASADSVKDRTGIREASELFFDHKIWEKVEDRSSQDWQLVREIFNACRDFNKEDKKRISQLNAIMESLGLEPESFSEELNTIVDKYEEKFLNNWELNSGELNDFRELIKLQEKLRDMEFGQQTHAFFAAYALRARVLTILGKEEEALEFMNRIKTKIIKYDQLLAEEINNNKELNREAKINTLEYMSVLPEWYFAKGVALFSKFRKEINGSTDNAGEFLFGNKGAAVYFYLCVKKYPESPASLKSIIAFQKIREIISEKFKKDIKDLVVSDLTQGKAFYRAEDFQNALIYLKKATKNTDSEESFEAYNFAVAAAVRLKDWNRSETLFAEMVKNHSALNKFPKNYITKSVNFLVATYLKLLVDSGKNEFLDKAVNIFKLAGDNGNKKSNVNLKYMLAIRLLNESVKYKKQGGFDQVKLALIKANEVCSSLINDHILSVESVKIHKNLGLTYQTLGMSEKAQNHLKVYLSKIPSFSSKIDVDQIRVRILLAELQVNSNKIKESEHNLTVAKKLLNSHQVEVRDSDKELLLESLAALEVKLLFNKLETAGNETAFLEKAKSFISEFKSSNSRPYIMAQAASVLQKNGNVKEANEIYKLLEKEYSGHDALEVSSMNQVLSLLKAGNESKALEVLQDSSYLEKLKAENLFALLISIKKGLKKTGPETSDGILKVVSVIKNKNEKLNDHMLQQIALIEASAYSSLKEFDKAKSILEPVIDEYKNGYCIIELKLALAICEAGRANYSEVSRIYSSLQGLITGMNGGRGDNSLNLKVSVEVAMLLKLSSVEKDLSKGKAIAYLASQYNPAVLEEGDSTNLEKAVFLNAFFSHQLGKSDFAELKKEFLKRYPYSNFAPELRKL